MGLNTDAITVGDTIAAKLGSPIKLTDSTATTAPNGALTGNFPKEAAAGTKPVYGTDSYHLTEENTGVIAPKFTIDLDGLSLTAATGKTLKIDIGGTEIELGGAAAESIVAGSKTITFKNGDTKTAGDIAAAIAKAYDGSAGGTADAAAANTLKHGGFFYKAEVNGTKVTFTAVGYDDGTGAFADISGLDDASKATDALGPSLGANGKGMVTLTGDKTDVKATDLTSHNIMDVTNPVAKGDSGMAGIDFDLSKNNIVADGNRLTIDGKTFVFKTDAQSDVKAGEGEILIDVSGRATDAEKIGEAVDQMSNYQTDNFKIQANGNNKIHIEQLKSSTEKYTTFDSLKAVFSARNADIGQGMNI